MTLNAVIPCPGSEWAHKSGETYFVIMISNSNSKRQSDFPTTVVYRRLSDLTVWSRPLSKWHCSMSPSKGIK